MTANNITVDESAVRHVLREFSEVQFVQGGWFCHGPPNPERDRLRNVTRKMLSVASPIELGVIREGLRRVYRYRGHRGVKTWSLLVPPRSVLRVTRVLDHGWTSEGQLWLAARIPAAHDAAHLVVSVPGPIRPYLSGRRFDVKDEDGISHGTVRVNEEGTSYGFPPFLRQHGADEGDILIAEFDLTKKWPCYAWATTSCLRS